MPAWLPTFLFDGDSSPDDAVFALKSTRHWMRALALLVEDGDFKPGALETFYSGIKARNPRNDKRDADAIERLLMARHHQSACSAIADNTGDPYPMIRMAIVAWYYVIYEGASAMNCAQSGSNTETHALTQAVWQENIVTRGLAIGPFAFHTTSLVEQTVKAEVEALSRGPKFPLTKLATTSLEARSQTLAYLKGTAKRERERKESEILKKASYTNFRTAVARSDRDRVLSKPKSMANFLTQAFRYRGKANYRDSLYLSYGTRDDEAMRQLASDLAATSAAFLAMTEAFVSRRVHAGTWSQFETDIDLRLLI